MRPATNRSRRSTRLTAASGAVIAAALLCASCSDDPSSKAAAESAAATTVAPAAAPTTTAAPAAPAAAETKEAELVALPRPHIDDLTAALGAGDLQASLDALEAYDANWNGVEVYVNVRSLSSYLKVEADLQVSIEEGLAADAPDFPALKAMSEELAARYDDVIAISQAGPPLSPLFDDLATLRLIRAELRITNAALEDGNVEKAAEHFATFADGFNDAYPLIKARNEDYAENAEHAIDDAVAAFAKAGVTAEELAPLTAKALSTYNLGVGLVNAAARNADPTKTEVTTADLLHLTQLHDVRIQLEKSFKAWQAGDFETSASVAKVAGTTALDRVAPALAAHGADAALRKLIDEYSALAGAAGDAKDVGDAEVAALRGILVAQQVLFGQFWSDDAVQNYLAGLPEVEPLT